MNKISLRVITCNVNGLRAANKKGFIAWMLKQKADVVCLQETKLQTHQVDPSLRPDGYYAYFFDAHKKGYSGVAIYTRIKPQRIHTGLGWPIADEEGRYLQVDFQDLSIASLYLPSGSSSQQRQDIKYAFLDRYYPVLEKQKDSRLIICGDWNIAHKPIDLENWRANQIHSGFLPEERAWLDRVLTQLAYVDGFRVVNQKAEEYTWWSYRGRAWQNNTGWRIDYQIVTPICQSTIRSARIYKDERFSDHAPLIMDYEF